MSSTTAREPLSDLHSSLPSSPPEPQARRCTTVSTQKTTSPRCMGRILNVTQVESDVISIQAATRCQSAQRDPRELRPLPKLSTEDTVRLPFWAEDPNTTRTACDRP